MNEEVYGLGALSMAFSIMISIAGDMSFFPASHFLTVRGLTLFPDVRLGSIRASLLCPPGLRESQIERSSAGVILLPVACNQIV